MNTRSRAKLKRAAEALQARYAAARRAQADRFGLLVAEGSFLAPAELLPTGPQLELGLAEPLREDVTLAEAA